MKKSIDNPIFKSLVVLIRVLFGTGWFLAGLTKITGKTGEVSWYDQPMVFLTEYLKEALDKPNVPEFYKGFIDGIALNHVYFLNYTIPITQIIMGICLIIGFMTLPAIFICLFMQINFILSGNMNLLSLTLYTSAFGLLFFKNDALILSLDRYFKVEGFFKVKKPNYVSWNETE
jgi:thiosulfate dehydrogenase (quinone) large subunit